MSDNLVPVEVVRGPKGPGFPRRFIEAIPTAIVTSLLTAFFLALWAPNISTYVALFRPTCADPRGLEEVPRSEMKLDAPTEDTSQYPASVLTDGRVANIWVPPMLPPEERPEGVSQREEFAMVDPRSKPLVISFDSAQDVQLVCVVNGLANGYSNYVNWGRVRSVRAWTDTNESEQLSVLASLDQGSFQNFQDVRVPRGGASELMIKVADLYEGQQVTSVDPDVCGTREAVGEGRRNDPVGCNLNAAPRAGIAEIKVYRLAEARWHALWPL